jgi:hypothetical protein
MNEGKDKWLKSIECQKIDFFKLAFSSLMGFVQQRRGDPFKGANGGMESKCSLV